MIAYDQRGHGRSEAAGDYSFDSFADDFGCVLAAVCADDERVIAAGHSMGAMTIAAWAAAAPTTSSAVSRPLCSPAPASAT